VARTQGSGRSSWWQRGAWGAARAPGTREECVEENVAYCRRDAGGLAAQGESASKRDQHCCPCSRSRSSDSCACAVEEVEARAFAAAAPGSVGMRGAESVRPGLSTARPSRAPEAVRYAGRVQEWALAVCAQLSDTRSLAGEDGAGRRARTRALGEPPAKSGLPRASARADKA